MRKLYVAGSFVFFHEGHQELLSDAMRIVGEGGEIMVAVNSDDFFKQYKGFVCDEFEDVRKENIVEFAKEHGAYAWHIVILDYDRQRKFLKYFKPDFILHGIDDMREEKLLKNLDIDQKFLDDNNILIVYTARRSGMSSTKLRKNNE